MSTTAEPGPETTNPSAPMGTRARNFPRWQRTLSKETSSMSAGPSTTIATPVSIDRVTRPERKRSRPAASRSPRVGGGPEPGSQATSSSLMTMARPSLNPTLGRGRSATTTGLRPAPWTRPGPGPGRGPLGRSVKVRPSRTTAAARAAPPHAQRGEVRRRGWSPIFWRTESAAPRPDRELELGMEVEIGDELPTRLLRRRAGTPRACGTPRRRSGRCNRSRGGPGILRGRGVGRSFEVPPLQRGGRNRGATAGCG